MKKSMDENQPKLSLHVTPGPRIEPRPQRRGERAHNRAGHVSDLNLIIVPCSLTVGYGSTKPESLEVRSLTDRDSYFS